MEPRGRPGGKERPTLSNPSAEQIHVTRHIPSYLRLHTSEPASRQQVPPSFDETATFWQCYSEVTGWRLDHRQRQASRPRLLPAVALDPMAGVDEYLESPAVPRETAEALATAAHRITTRLCDAMETIRLQDAELTAQAGALMPVQRRAEFADKLEAILRDAIEATGCDAGAVYLMDEETTELRRRAQVGLPEPHAIAATRPMRGALGDLEALINGVMSVDDLGGLEGEIWNSPEPFASGICAAVGEDDLPLGTLWLWSVQPRSFEASHRAVARLAASHSVSEIARENLSRQQQQERKAKATLRSASSWQERQLPVAMPLAKGWTADGWTEAAMPLAKSWFTWDILPDGTIAAVVAEACSQELDAAMIAATARAAFQSHSGYPLRPRQMLQRIADTLWQTNSGQQLVSLLYARIDPE